MRPAPNSRSGLLRSRQKSLHNLLPAPAQPKQKQGEEQAKPKHSPAKSAPAKKKAASNTAKLAPSTKAQTKGNLPQVYSLLHIF